MRVEELIKRFVKIPMVLQLQNRQIPIVPLHHLGMIYDEVSITSFLDILFRVGMQPGEVFHDLGSGVEKKLPQQCTHVLP